MNQSPIRRQAEKINLIDSSKQIFHFNTQLIILIFQYLVSGSQSILQRNFYTTIGNRLGLKPPADFNKPKNPQETRNKERKDKKTKAKNKSANSNKEDETGNKDNDEDITLTQIVKKYEFIGKSDNEDDEENFMKELEEKHKIHSPLILIQSVKVSSFISLS